jgi:DNA segregation ATPase FtsK/SpoIIIE, S-DNA-T family
LTIGWALLGVVRAGWQLLAWWHVPDMARLESQAAADGLVSDHLRIHKAGKETRKARGLILAISGAAAVFVVVTMVRFAPWWAWVVLGVAALPLLARAGRPAASPSSSPPCSRTRCSHHPRM